MTTRRKLLQAVGAGSVALVAHSGVGSAGGDSTKRVPEVKAGDEVLEYMEVPEKWLQQHDKAKRVKRRFNSEWISEDGVLSTELVASDERFGGKPGFQIRMTVDPETFKREAPDEKEGVRVATERGSRDDMRPHCENDQNYDDMPGGVWIEGDSATPRGTSFCEVEYNGTYYMMTAAHLFGTTEPCDGHDIPDPADQFDRDLGYLEGYHTEYDLAICSASENGIELYDYIYGEDSQWPVKGYETESKISNRVVTTYDSYKQMGTSTGIKDGHIRAKDRSNDECPTFNDEAVVGSCGGADGDSGGPAFSVNEDGEANLIYMHSWGVNGDTDTYDDCGNEYVSDDTMGTAAYRINDVGYNRGT
jgi:hypothetical protein